MSSMDQAFVRAFSRRRLATPNQPNERPAETPPVEREEESGSLQLDRSVTGSAEVWVDQIARADQANEEIPRPHVDSAVSFELPRVEPKQVEPKQHEPMQQEASGDPVDAPHEAQPIPSDTTPGETPANPDPLQHIHTAYAGVFADPSWIAAHTSAQGDVQPDHEAPMSEPEVEQSETFGGASVDSLARLDSLAPFDTTAAAVEVETEAVPAIVEEEPLGPSDDVVEQIPTVETEPTWNETSAAMSEVAENSEVVENSEGVEGSDPDTTYVPFQAVWEVDVFDVPTPVADLFFEGALFQQIAEQMSEAVGSGLRTVLVTSARPGEGRSSVAIGTAMAAAAAGIRVALVDADTESPSLADELRLELQYGWVDVIRRGLPIKEIAVQAIEDGVTLIPLMPPGVRQAATAFEMVQLVDLLKSNFELIILDGPTSLSKCLQPCASKVDSAIIVRDVTQSNELAVSDLARSLQAAGVRGVGVVENFV